MLSFIFLVLKEKRVMVVVVVVVVFLPPDSTPMTSPADCCLVCPPVPGEAPKSMAERRGAAGGARVAGWVVMGGWSAVAIRRVKRWYGVTHTHAHTLTRTLTHTHTHTHTHRERDRDRQRERGVR